MASNLQGLDIALGNQLDREFNDVTTTEHTILGMMMALDAFYKRGGADVTVRTAPLDEQELRIMYELGLPYSQGIDPMNPDFESLKLPLRQGYTVEGGTLRPSAYQLGPEVIQKYQVNRFKGDEATADWVAKVSAACKKSLVISFNNDLFPTSDLLTPTKAAGVNGQPAIDKLMAFGYPLAAGGPNNVAGVSGTDVFPLYTIDLNLTRYQALRAVNAGTTTTPFGNPTPSNIRTKILMPLRKNLGRPDLWVMGAGPYNYMISTPEDQVRLTQSASLQFGGEYASFPNTTIMLENALTDQAANTTYDEAYFVTSSELLWGMQGGMSDFTVLNDVEQAPSFMMIQGYKEVIFFIRNPRRCAHAFNIKY